MLATRKAPIITLRGVSKRYNGISVLRDVDLDIGSGEIRCLVGENGAGKSTLLRILAGAVRADDGSLSLDGDHVAVKNPRDALGLGISLITQEGALVAALTALENVFLARWSNRLGFRRSREDRTTFAQLLDYTGFSIDPHRRVDELPRGAQQQVEILRALARGSNVLALDEPTAVLTEHEKANLLGLIRKLSAAGFTVILVSHFLDEVLSVAHRVTVLRDGREVITDDIQRHTTKSLVKHMVGEQIDIDSPGPTPVKPGAPIRLEARGLSGGIVHGVDIKVREGEILGIGGLVGSGRSEVLRLLFGADSVNKGNIEIDGVAAPRLTPRKAMLAGLAMVPESRKEQGLILTQSVRHNVALASLDSRSKGPFVEVKMELAEVDAISDAVDIRCPRLDAPIETLSGGNQQKALFAKWLLRKPRVLLIDEPTRGVDIAAKAKIQKLILGLAHEGVAVVIVSSEIEELMELSHRAVVMRRGKLVGQFSRGTPREEILAAAFGDGE